jgi:hypothetical protein
MFLTHTDLIPSILSPTSVEAIGEAAGRVGVRSLVFSVVFRLLDVTHHVLFYVFTPSCYVPFVSRKFIFIIIINVIIILFV